MIEAVVMVLGSVTTHESEADCTTLRSWAHGMSRTVNGIVLEVTCRGLGSA